MNPTYKTSLQSPQAFDESVIFTNLLHDVTKCYMTKISQRTLCFSKQFCKLKFFCIKSLLKDN